MGISIDVLLKLREDLKSSLSLLDVQLLNELTLWQSKAENGFKVEAIIQYRKEKNCTLSEAKEAVDTFCNYL